MADMAILETLKCNGTHAPRHALLFSRMSAISKIHSNPEIPPCREVTDLLYLSGGPYNLKATPQAAGSSVGLCLTGRTLAWLSHGNCGFYY